MSALAVVALILLAGVLVTIRPALAQTSNTCATGTAVPDPDNNPGLVSDCEALLASRDTLAGNATLNWSAAIPIAQWDGITVSGRPQRVTELVLQNKGLEVGMRISRSSVSSTMCIRLKCKS